MNSTHASRLFSTAAITSLVASSAVFGCTTAAEERVSSRLDVIHQTGSALSAASITSISGRYGGACDGHNVNGADTWTSTISGTLASDELSVRKNDANCVLSLTAIVTADGSFAGADPIALGTSYPGSATLFSLSLQPSFYGNAKISASDFAANFTITLLVSDTPRASAAPDKGATFATQTATVSSGTVTAPNYTISYADFGVQKDVNNVVSSVSGYAQLTTGGSDGQDYAIYLGDLTSASSPDAVATAFAGAATSGLLSALTTLQAPASGFGLGAVVLGTSPQRTVIIRNTVGGVSSYELLRVTFVP